MKLVKYGVAVAKKRVLIAGLWSIITVVMCYSSASYKIPKIRHTVWLGKEFPALFHMYHVCWRQKHPTWTHILWVDDAHNYIFGQYVEPSVTDICTGKHAGKLIVCDIRKIRLYNQEQFDTTTDYNEKSDIARYELLYTYGGAYVNADCQCIQPFDHLHRAYDFYAGSTTNNGERLVNNGVFGASMGHPILKECILKIKANTICPHTEPGYQAVHLTEAFYESEHVGNVGLLSESYFFHVNEQQKNLQEYQLRSLLSPHCYCIVHEKERDYNHVSCDNKHVIGLHGTAEGLFSALKGVIHHLMYCIRFHKTPVVYWDESSVYYQSEGYNGATNAWDYYFEPVSTLRYMPGDHVWTSYGAPDNTGITIESDQCRNTSFRKMIKESVIDRFIKIRPYILEKVDAFYRTCMQGKRTIGIHIRCTDRSADLSKISFAKIIDAANKYADGNTQFLIATDEERLLHEAKKLVHGPVIAYNSYRSHNGLPIHLRTVQNYSQAQLGEEALIEALLLSKCSLFIHTVSNFSYAALLFNPEVESVLLR